MIANLQSLEIQNALIAFIIDMLISQGKRQNIIRIRYERECNKLKILRKQTGDYYLLFFPLVIPHSN